MSDHFERWERFEDYLMKRARSTGEWENVGRYWRRSDGVLSAHPIESPYNGLRTGAALSMALADALLPIGKRESWPDVDLRPLPGGDLDIEYTLLVETACPKAHGNWELAITLLYPKAIEILG